MKKSNFLTLLFLCVMIVAVMVFAAFASSDKQDNVPDNSSSESSVTTAPTTSTEPQIPTTEGSSSTETSSPTETTDSPSTEPAGMTDALFIGDSRTVGIMEYSGISEADYFCNTGMSVFNVREDRVSVPNVGKVTLTELVSNKKYGKIYVMLGINELGYNFQSIVDKYSELLEFVEENQPDAAIFIQANLHVSKKRSDSDKVINNSAINKINGELSKLADNKSKFYLDANALFDDASGNLSIDKTQDNAHLYAKYYAKWGEWICRETAKYVKEE